jgi:hypothetical protein
MSKRTRAQESRAAIEKLYIVMRHLFNRGYYKPFGVSGQELVEALKTLSPEIYGSMADPHKVELDGLVYVIDRLPKGIESCRFIRLISEEGYISSGFEAIVPPKRRRNCYRIDKDQMLVEVTRGRSEIYDILTHLTFLYIEAEKIRKNVFHENGQTLREWKKLEEIVNGDVTINEKNEEKAFAYLSTILGRTFDETQTAHKRFQENPDNNSGLYQVVYHLGKLAHEEKEHGLDREISFSPSLRERIGHHIYGEIWANDIKKRLIDEGLEQRPIHIISANMHSVMNSLYAYPLLMQKGMEGKSLLDIATMLNGAENRKLQQEIEQFALENGMLYLKNTTGTHLSVQIFDASKLPFKYLPAELQCDVEYVKREKPVIIVMDYAFGEQAYETMDELLKPCEVGNKIIPLQVLSISIMGKAGILDGDKGDIMIPTSHVFEGTADNYPFVNQEKKEEYEGHGLKVVEGSMITVLGTSLQNKDVLEYFKNSSWNAIGLEMEGAHYQKAIQAAAKIRNSIDASRLVLRYAYYASDNPLLTGSTLASGSLGMIGVKPTYLITLNMLKKILQQHVPEAVF